MKMRFGEDSCFWALAPNRYMSEWFVDVVRIFRYRGNGQWAAVYANMNLPETYGRTRAEAVLKFRIARPCETLYELPDLTARFNSLEELTDAVKEVPE